MTHLTTIETRPHTAATTPLLCGQGTRGWETQSGKPTKRDKTNVLGYARDLNSAIDEIVQVLQVRTTYKRVTYESRQTPMKRTQIRNGSFHAASAANVPNSTL